MLSLNGMSFDALKAFLKEHSEVKAIYACLSNTKLSIDTIKDIPFDSKKVVNMQTYLKDYTAENGLVETWNVMLKEEFKKIRKAKYKSKDEIIANELNKLMMGERGNVSEE